MKRKYSSLTFLLVIALGFLGVACNDSKSYADLLTEQDHSVNNFLSQQRVEMTIPADSNFEVGPDAPYYCLDDEGAVYMQVLEKGDMNDRPEVGVRVYFRYLRYSVHTYVVGSDDNTGAGNANNMAAEPVFFTFDQYTLTQSVQHGTGIQLPMKYLGYNCRVNLLIKSTAGPTSEQTYVTPYLYNVQYFKQLI